MLSLYTICINTKKDRTCFFGGQTPGTVAFVHRQWQPHGWIGGGA